MRKHRPRHHHITPEAVELFKQCLELHGYELRDKQIELHRSLGINTFIDYSPVDVPAEMPSYLVNHPDFHDQRQNWRIARALRDELELQARRLPTARGTGWCK